MALGAVGGVCFFSSMVGVFPDMRTGEMGKGGLFHKCLLKET